MALSQKLVKAAIWVEESFTFAYHIPSAHYYEAIHKSLERINTLYPDYKHYIKLRPRQNSSSSPILEVLSAAGYAPEVLDQKIMIEPLLLRSSDCVVIGCVSSVLYYAVLFGHRSLSMFDFIKDKPFSVFDELDSYWKQVEKLSPA